MDSIHAIRMPHRSFTAVSVAVRQNCQTLKSEQFGRTSEDPLLDLLELFRIKSVVCALHKRLINNLTR